MNLLLLICISDIDYFLIVHRVGSTNMQSRLRPYHTIPMGGECRVAGVAVATPTFCMYVCMYSRHKAHPHGPVAIPHPRVTKIKQMVTVSIHTQHTHALTQARSIRHCLANPAPLLRQQVLSKLSLEPVCCQVSSLAWQSIKGGDHRMFKSTPARL